MEPGWCLPAEKKWAPGNRGGPTEVELRNRDCEQARSRNGRLRPPAVRGERLMRTGLVAVLVAGTLAAPLQGQEKAAPKADAVTFAEHVAPIVFSKCVTCHRPGEVGPFSLLTYQDVRKRGKMIQLVT